MFHAFEQALKKVFAENSFAWWFPICATGCVAIALLPLSFESSDASATFYVVVTTPLVSVVLLGSAYKCRKRQRLIALSTMTMFVIFTTVLFARFLDTRDAVRWFINGKTLEAKVLAQSSLAHSLRHTEWEGWGFAGSDTTVYLVFDPKDTLATAAKERTSGKFGDLPCEVYRIRKRENGWYTVQFYTNTDWESCGN